MKRKTRSSTDSSDAKTQAEIDADPTERRFVATRCAWINQPSGKHCLMPGERSRQGVTSGIESADGTFRAGPRYCAFHVDAVDRGRGVRRGLFDEWIATWVETWGPPRYPASVWTRFDSETIWLAITGEARYPAPAKGGDSSPRATSKQVGIAFGLIRRILGQPKDLPAAQRIQVEVELGKLRGTAMVSVPPERVTYEAKEDDYG